ncbi:MAG: DUF3999 domain-containing protein [Gammaproteobacteria bacterium]|nr:DUF3999 domain-containing protein [Gammaproteobacteria bacterium]
MKCSFGGILITAWLSLLVGPADAQELPSADDYAYAFPLMVKGSTEFFELDVPVEFYRSVSDPSLRDAGVYNANGLPVPRIFEHPAGAESEIEEQVALGVVPLHADVSEQPEQLRLLLQQAGTGINLKLEASEAGEISANKPLKAYIVDVRDLEHEIVALVFNWPKQSQGFIGRVTVEHGDNLQHWRRLGSASLATLEYDDTRIVQNRVELTGKVSDYLRISWRNMPDSWKLDAVTGIYTSQGLSASRDSVTLESTAQGNTNREFLFDAGGFPPVDRVNLVLPGDNVVIRASIFSRQDEKGRWRLAHKGLFYSISRQGELLQTTPARISVSRASQWKVKLESGVTTNPVQIQLEWQPDRLAFVAQGSPPFELVAGSAQDRLQQFPQKAILGDRSIFKMLRESGQAGVATTGAREVRAGPDRLEVAATKPWRVALLWGGLIGAVLLVAGLVYSLMRDMRKDGQS